MGTKKLVHNWISNATCNLNLDKKRKSAEVKPTQRLVLSILAAQEEIALVQKAEVNGMQPETNLQLIQ